MPDEIEYGVSLYVIDVWSAAGSLELEASNPSPWPTYVLELVVKLAFGPL